MHICELCAEDWPAALYKNSGLCRNHAVEQAISDEPYRKYIAHCPTCGRSQVPAQSHHVAGVRQHRTLCILLCLNCHGIATARQCTDLDPPWKTEHHPVRCIVQGVYDLLWLWWQRSGRFVWEWQLAELVRLVWLALLALADIWGLRGWDVVL
jgi:hypothetical protein